MRTTETFTIKVYRHTYDYTDHKTVTLEINVLKNGTYLLELDESNMDKKLSDIVDMVEVSIR